MKLIVKLGQHDYVTDTDDVIDISIPMVFNGEQPNTYRVPKARARAYEDGRFVGDTRRGGSCNFETYELVPHCNGTHTECVGHITHQRIAVNGVLRKTLIPATLITVDPENADTTTESYSPPKQSGDRLITAKSLFYKLESAPREFLEALIIRTLPNDDSKISRDYMQSPPPYFSIEAMDYMAGLGVHHLLVDTPSIDRLFDEGQLHDHHMFWSVPFGHHEVDEDGYSVKTITEMVYVPDHVGDGTYFVSLQIAPFVTDAAPSRPLLVKPSTD